ncbi:X2-like carbohydrate binding domain-containing protein [Paenibacillus allorhizosphaerae]|uniref:X2-like carbohydrate binding domain-containing protein n=1 Tax=Paenibacillus allorhizosphaerae TaxID=2849866 RepID=UPI00367225E2
MRSWIAAILCMVIMICPLIQPVQADAAGLMFTSMSSQRDTTFALDANGRIWAWGSNLSGQFGNGITPSSHTPMQIKVLDNGAPVSFKEIKGGYDFAIALDSSGHLWGAGDNGAGQLGLGSGTLSARNWTKANVMDGGTPVVFKKIAASRSSSFALDSNGKLWIWGFRTLTADPYVPTKQTVAYGNGDPVVFDALEGNDEFVIAIDSQQHLWTIFQPAYNPSPFTVMDGGVEAKFQSISAGSTLGTGPFLGLAIDTNGDVWSWGGNDQGQLGDGGVSGTLWAPNKISITDNGNPVKFVRVSGGLKHVLAIDEAGSMWTWGLNSSGQLGDGSTVNTAPHKVPVSDNGAPFQFASVWSGYAVSYGLDADGRLWSWGRQGLLGDNTSGNGLQTTPKKIFFKPQLSLTASVTNATYLEPVTLTASVAGDFVTPSGTVTFKEGDQQLGSVPLDTGGDAHLNLPSLPTGSHTLTALYEGDNLYLAGTTNPVSVTVTMPLAPSVKITPSTTAPTTEPVTLTVTAQTYGTSNTLFRLKWLPGDNTAAAFADAGTDIFTVRNFAVAGNGTYTVYAKDLAGSETVQKINVTNIVPLPNNSAIAPAAASFDKNAGSAENAEVTTTLTLNGNTLSGIANGAALLTPGTDYTVSGNTITILKAYLNAQPVGLTRLTFKFSGGADQTMTISVSDSTPNNSAIAPAAASFDKYAGSAENAEVTTTLTLNGNTLSGIANGAALLMPGTDYTVSGNTVTILNAYLNAQPVGLTRLTFKFSGGADQTMTISVSDSTPNNSAIAPAAASFDKYAGSAENAEVTTTLTLNDNTLSGITNDAEPLTPGTDYTLSGNTVTILKAYLNTQPVGLTRLTFKFSGGTDQTMTITVSDSTPLPSNEEPESDSSSTPITEPVTVADPPKYQIALDSSGHVVIIVDSSSFVTEEAGGTLTQKLIVTADVLNQAQELLKDASQPIILIKLSDTEPSVQVQLPGGSLETMADAYPNAAIGIELNGSSLVLQASVLDLDSLAKRLGVAVSDVNIVTSMERVSDAVETKLEQMGSNLGFRVVGHAVDFKVKAAANGQTVELHDFGSKYMTRGIVYTNPSASGNVIAVHYDPFASTVSYIPTHLGSRSDGKKEAVMRATHYSIYAAIETKDRSFADLSAHWAKEDVEHLASRLIVTGVSADRFAPDESITRAEFAALLVRSLGLSTEHDPAYKSFEDVPASAWYSAVVEAAVKAGLVDGMTADSFAPNERITREQMAVMLARALSLTPEGRSIQENKQALAVFQDQDAISTWSQAFVSRTVQAGIITGTDDGNFAPAQYATRAQAATMLKRFLLAVHFIE